MNTIHFLGNTILKREEKNGEGKKGIGSVQLEPKTKCNFAQHVINFKLCFLINFHVTSFLGKNGCFGCFLNLNKNKRFNSK
jgi:hypothetical protein